MSPPGRRRLDNVYLLYFIVHLVVLLGVDLVPWYPAALWVPDAAPLHPLYELRAWYVQTYHDPLLAAEPQAAPAWFRFFSFTELVLHPPVTVWAIRRLGGCRPLRGKDELLLLMYGLHTALTTATCMYETWLWDPAVVTTAQKLVLVCAMYGGYLAAAVLLSVDMYTRLLARLAVPDSPRKTQ